MNTIKCWRLSSHLQRQLVSDENPDARWQGTFEECQILKSNPCSLFRCSYFSSTTFTYILYFKLFHTLRINSRHFTYWLIILQTTKTKWVKKNTTSMFDVGNTHICSSKMVFEVCKVYMLMLLIKGKNHLEILHHVFLFNIYASMGF